MIFPDDCPAPLRQRPESLLLVLTGSVVTVVLVAGGVILGCMLCPF